MPWLTTQLVPMLLGSAMITLGPGWVLAQESSPSVAQERESSPAPSLEAAAGAAPGDARTPASNASAEQPAEPEPSTDATAPKPAPPPIESVLESARRVGSSWDVQLELGIPVWTTTWVTPNFEGWLKDLADVYSFGNAYDDIRNDYLPFLVRGRFGYLALSEPWYFGIGVTAQYDSLAEFALGAQAELTHIWGGVWAQFEGAYSFSTGPLITAAAGYKLFGAELRATRGGQDFGVLLKVRVPVGLIVYVREIYDKARVRRRVGAN